ncbi:ATP-binding cassette domain-containing protein [Enterococcus sp. LJL98]
MIRDLSLQINDGEFFDFIGSNSAGKSTMIKALLDFIKPAKV